MSVGDLSDSPFHQAMNENTDFLNYMKNDPVFLTGRFCMNLLYLFMDGLGLKLRDRYLLCYYISKAAEDVYEIDPLYIVNNFYVDKNGDPIIA